MPRRTTIRLSEVVSAGNLMWAFWRAARGRRHQPDVRAFEARVDSELAGLRGQVLSGTIRLGEFRRFEIHDPKRRMIHAPAFRERVLHHALMRLVGPVLDRSLIDDTYACRAEKGGLAAARRAQVHCRRHPWVLKMDIRSYFASIDHGVLKRQLRRRIQGTPALELIDRIVNSFGGETGCGLPIGALTSQHFANLYLSPLDRFLEESVRVPGMVRYMDDIVVWGRSRHRLAEVRSATEDFVAGQLALEVKAGAQIQRTSRGVTMCGFRVIGDRLLLSQRRRRRYRLARRRWENAFDQGWIGATELQAGYASALAITAGADARRWRSAELRCRAGVDA